MVYSVDRILIDNLDKFKNYCATNLLDICLAKVGRFLVVNKIEKRWQYEKASGTRATSQCVH